jgi:hypothetical protein
LKETDHQEWKDILEKSKMQSIRSTPNQRQDIPKTTASIKTRDRGQEAHLLVGEANLLVTIELKETDHQELAVK